MQTPAEIMDADEVMNPQHFSSDPADIRTRILINTSGLNRKSGFEPLITFGTGLDVSVQVCAL